MLIYNSFIKPSIKKKVTIHTTKHKAFYKQNYNVNKPVPAQPQTTNQAKFWSQRMSNML
ncbi:hypothetical protein Hanom_Chr16g01417941 [Helianthus anomalus]